jgi:hypothetical protein
MRRYLLILLVASFAAFALAAPAPADAAFPGHNGLIAWS